MTGRPTNLRMLRHPVTQNELPDEMNARILDSQLHQQRVLTWVLGGLGGAALLLLLGVAFVVWRIVFTIS